MNQGRTEQRPAASEDSARESSEEETCHPASVEDSWGSGTSAWGMERVDKACRTSAWERQREKSTSGEGAEQRH